jgi:phage-related protein
MAEGIKIGSAFVEVKADSKGAFNGVDSEASAAGTKAGGLFKGAFGKGLAGMGTALAGAFAVDKVTSFISTAVNGASDLNEETSKSQTIFGAASKDIENWAKTSATSVGLSSAETLKATGTFGNMFTQMGFGGKAAASMSKDVLGLSADLGSFNNLPTADVADAMGAAFRGEYDSIQNLLPGINAASVEQQALTMTGKKSAKALTDQEKAAAVLALAHKGGAKAQGDFAKTQGGFAGQSKIAEASMKNMAASIGTVLLPIATSLMSFVNTDLIPGLKNIGSFIQTNVVPAFTSFGTAIMGAMPVISTIAGIIGLILLPALIRSGIQMAITAAAHVVGWVTMSGAAVMNAARTVAAWVLMGMQSMINAARMAAAWLIAMGPVGIVIAIIIGLVAIVIANWDTIRNFTVTVFNNVVSFLTTVWNNIVTWITQAVNNIRNTVTNVFNAVKGFIQTVFNNIKSFIQTVWNGIKATIQTVIGVIKTIITNIFNGIKTFIQNTWNGIKTNVSNTINGIKSTIQNVFTAAKTIVSGIFDGIKSKISGVFEGIKSTVSGAVGAIRDTVQRVFGTLSGIMTGAFNGVSGTIRGVINGVIGAINGAIGGINSAIDIANKLPGVNIGHMGTIPMLATGGTLKRGGAAIVGEKGPELVTLPGGATVHPNGSAFSVAGNSESAKPVAQTVNNTYHITIDAKNVKDFQSVVDIMSNINQTARAGRGAGTARIA